MALKFHGRLLSLDNREPNPEAVFDPNSARIQEMLARAQFDSGNISSKELAVMERVAGPLAKKSRTMFNPFTGEFRKVEY